MEASIISKLSKPCLNLRPSNYLNLQLTLSSSSPRPIFSQSNEFCMLMVKFVDQCKETWKADALNDDYPSICPSITLLRPLIKTTIQG